MNSLYYMLYHHDFNNKRAWWIGLLFCEELLLCRIITQKFHSSWIFFYLGFISKTLAIHGTAEEGRVPYQFLYTISTHSQTFKHLFTVLHLRWLPYIFNCVGYRFSIDNTYPNINL